MFKKKTKSKLKDHDSTENVTDSLGTTLETIAPKEKTSSSYPGIFDHYHSFVMAPWLPKIQKWDKMDELSATWASRL